MSPTLRSLRKEEDRQRLCAIAVDLIRAQGYEATTIRDITAKAGVALGTFFNHFPTKEHLLVDYYEALHQEVERTFATPPVHFAAFVEAFTALILRQATQHPEIFRAVGLHLPGSPALQAAEAATCGDMHRRMAEAVARGQAAGELRGLVDPGQAASLLMLVYNGAVYESLPDLDAAAFAARVKSYLDPLVRLLRA